MRHIPGQDSEIVSEPDEIRYLTVQEIKELKNLKTYANDLDKYATTKRCPVCDNDLTEECTPRGSHYFCKKCGYGVV